MNDGRTGLRDEGLEILDEGECLQLMSTVPVGRVAVSLGALAAVFPVNFALLGRRIVFRTGRGTKLDAAVRHAVVAFEVDAFDPGDQSGWSVLAVGRGEDVTDVESIGHDDVPRPWAGGERDHYVAIEAEFVSGRRLERTSASCPPKVTPTETSAAMTADSTAMPTGATGVVTGL